MAESDAATGSAKGGFDFLKTKLGPLPVGVWIVAALGIWWYLNRQNSASASSAVPTTTEAVDPNTGVPYSQEIGAYGQQVADLQAQAQNAQATSGSTTAGQYQDNGAWSVAAINYLVAQGVDASQANQAITLYLASQTLTTQEQADVNLAIQALGAPPQPPGPAQTNPGQIVTPPGTTPPPKPPIILPPAPKPPVPANVAPPMPSGVKVVNVTATSVSVRWNPSKGATSYIVRVTYQSKLFKQATTSGTAITVTGLRPDSTMDVHVAAHGPGGTSAETGNGFHTPR